MAKKVNRKEITICVTAKDIENGVEDHVEKCPIARAAKRHTQGRVQVDGEQIFLQGELHSLPPKARSFVDDFDSYRQVKPFKFHLRVVRKGR